MKTEINFVFKLTVDKVELACHSKNNFYLNLPRIYTILGSIFSYSRQK